jgi:hypothetical protein
MDPLDAFYQELDSQKLLDQHGPGLRDEAREAIAADPQLRLAGLITLPDSPDSAAVRRLLANLTGRPVPEGALLVGLVLRVELEQLLMSRCDPQLWREEAWQPQQVLAVLVSTRDGHRIGCFPFDGHAIAGG